MNEKIKYGLIGTGRLGSEVEALFKENQHEAVLKENKEENKQTDVPQLLIDCSLPEAFAKTISYAQEFNIPVIMATTGLSESQINQLKKVSISIPVVQSYNFSVGIQVLLMLAESAGKILNDWDVEITETHHRFKQDKPSGTAKMILDTLGKNNIEISSLRLGNVPGEHTVYFGGLGEVLSITHSAISRRAFAEGILKSAEFIMTKEKGFYSFKDVVFTNINKG